MHRPALSARSSRRRESRIPPHPSQTPPSPLDPNPEAPRRVVFVLFSPYISVLWHRPVRRAHERGSAGGDGGDGAGVVDNLGRPKKTLGYIQLDARLWMRLTGTRRRRVRAQAPVNQTHSLRREGGVIMDFSFRIARLFHFQSR